MMKVLNLFCLLLLLVIDPHLACYKAAEQSSASESDGELWQAIENKHFRTLNTHTSLAHAASIKVYFWPASASSYQVELALQNWQLKHLNVTIKRIPLVKRPDWRLLAKTYLVSQDLQLAEQFLNQLYMRIHHQTQTISSEQSLKPILEALNIDQIDFFARLHSPKINQQLALMEVEHKQLQLTGVPSIIINNKWLTDASHVASSAQLLKVIDSLLLRADQEENVQARTSQ